MYGLPCFVWLLVGVVEDVSACTTPEDHSPPNPHSAIEAQPSLAGCICTVIKSQCLVHCSAWGDAWHKPTTAAAGAPYPPTAKFVPHKHMHALIRARGFFTGFEPSARDTERVYHCHVRLTPHACCVAVWPAPVICPTEPATRPGAGPEAACSCPGRPGGQPVCQPCPCC